MELFLETGRVAIVEPRSGYPTEAFQEWRRAITLEVAAQTGQLVGTNAQRLLVDVSILPAGTFFYATDRQVTYILLQSDSVRRWYYLMGVMRGVYNATPTLGAYDVGFLYDVADYSHLMRWTGATWEFAAGDDGNGYIADFVVAPNSVIGWALCDGGNTSYLDVVGDHLVSVPFTTPALSGTPAYKKSGAAYSGAITTAGGGLTGAGAVDPSHITVLPYFRR